MNWGKKGQEISKVVLPKALYLGMFAFVLLSFVYTAMTVNSNEAYKRQLEIMQRGLNFQLLQASKDTNEILDIKTSEYLVFTGTDIYTQVKGKQAETFVWSQVPGYLFTGGEFKQGSTLKQYKTGKRLGVAPPEKTPSQYLLFCDSPKGKPLKKIALDPGHGYDETTSKGSKGDNIISLATTESKYTLRLANQLKAVNPRFELTRDTETETAITDRQQTAGDAMVSLHAGSREDNLDVVKAYYNNVPGSKRLACEILNQLTEEFKIPVRMIPVNTDYLLEEDPKQVLNAQRPAIMLELGNAKKPDSVLTKIGEIQMRIDKGIENYGVG